MESSCERKEKSGFLLLFFSFSLSSSAAGGANLRNIGGLSNTTEVSLRHFKAKIASLNYLTMGRWTGTWMVPHRYLGNIGGEK